MLSTTTDEMHDSWLLGQQLSFITVDHAMLNSDFLKLTVTSSSRAISTRIRKA